MYHGVRVIMAGRPAVREVFRIRKNIAAEAWVHSVVSPDYLAGDTTAV